MSEKEEQSAKSITALQKLGGFLIVAVVIGIISLFLVGQAKPIADQTKLEYVNQNIYTILENNYAFYMKVAEERAGKELTPLEVYYPSAKGETKENGSVLLSNESEDEVNSEEEYYEENIDKVYTEDGEYVYTYQSEIQDFLYDIYWQNKSEQSNGIEYAIKDDMTGKTITSGEEAKGMEEAILLEEIGDLLQEKYEFCALIRYYEDGTLEVMDSYGMEKTLLESRLFRNSLTSRFGDYFVPNDIKGITIAMGITKEALQSVPYSDLSLDYGYTTGIFLEEGFIVVLLMAYVAVFLLAAVLMFIRTLGISTGFASKISLECNVAATILTALGTPLMIIFTYVCAKGGVEERLLRSGAGKYLSELIGKYAGVMEVILWMLYFAVIFIMLIGYFQLFRKGLRRYLKENTLIVRFCLWIVRGIKKIIKGVMSFDLEDDANRVALRIVALNFVIIAGMCSIWFFGLGVLIIYSIVLFFILRQYYSSVKQKYRKIVDAAEKMASGDLNTEIHDDLGMFNDLRDELSNVQRGFKHAVEEEVKSQNMKTELITNVSHDLKTPLTAIITYINLLKDDKLSEEERKAYLDTLDRKSLRLKQLIEDLFEVSKLNSNNVELHLMKVDIVSLIKQVEFEFTERFEEKKLEFRMTAPDEKVYVNLDGQKTFRIFENLFGNIIKYAMPSTRAYLTIKADEKEVKILVKNISENELNIESDTLLERFVRGDKSRNTEGSGLGLAIVNSLVEKQGGTLALDVDGDLFKITIVFPRMKEEKKEDIRKEESSERDRTDLEDRPSVE